MYVVIDKWYVYIFNRNRNIINRCFIKFWVVYRIYLLVYVLGEKLWGYMVLNLSEN